MFPVRDELITPDFLVCWSLTQIVSKGSHLKTIHFTGWVVTSINSADKAKRIKVLDDPTRGLSSPETEFGVSFRSADIYPTDDYPGGSLGSCLGPKVFFSLFPEAQQSWSIYVTTRTTRV
ncbi:Hypothetical protein NTJ_12785 [Nesidiocoris tenuis]|uniref:Uncharacterized protein n=1 Tax=Nesidiocoris tenuis TaxID=355587 RepID=A0ABN7B6T8_9HEMI|nr:Hypothetical protein NTJ_12785 [Nesidiocoris tenuis]